MKRSELKVGMHVVFELRTRFKYAGPYRYHGVVVSLEGFNAAGEPSKTGRYVGMARIYEKQATPCAVAPDCIVSPWAPYAAEQRAKRARKESNESALRAAAAGLGVDLDCARGVNIGVGFISGNVSARLDFDDITVEQARTLLAAAVECGLVDHSEPLPTETPPADDDDVDDDQIG